MAWVAGALLLAMAGCTGAWIAARAQARQAAAQGRQALAATSAQIASTLTLSILHESDLIVSAAAYVGANPTASNAQFKRWVSSQGVLQRYPELLGIGHATVVRASQLAAFAAAAVKDPVGPLAPNGAFKVVPPGHRPFYCLLRGSWSRPGPTSVSYPAGYDLCSDGPVAEAINASRDSGISAYVPVRAGRTSLLGVQTAVYRGGVSPSTISARRAAFAGGVGLILIPQALLSRALAGHPGLGITFSFRNTNSDVSFQAGHPPRGGETVTTSLHNGWRLHTVGARSDAAILQQPISRSILSGGIVSSLLVAALVAVLGTGRTRAARLVNLKTGELRHQALHDDLTGLPNRALINDRLDRLQARSRRGKAAGAVLFIDLDGFKVVNDTFGHQTGDRLLKAVADRLASALREVDTLGRLGGDEFIILLDGESGPTPEVTAERLLETIARPFHLDGLETVVTVTASVGIASGVRPTREHLLHDADLALYRAKDNGRNRYELFQAEALASA